MYDKKLVINLLENMIDATEKILYRNIFFVYLNTKKEAYEINKALQEVKQGETNDIEELFNELYNDKNRLVEAQEYNLLKAYDRGELSLGQVANILNISKTEIMELLKEYDIPFICVDSEYMEQEFSAFR